MSGSGNIGYLTDPELLRLFKTLILSKNRFSKHCISQTVRAKVPKILRECSSPPMWYVSHIICPVSHVI